MLLYERWYVNAYKEATYACNACLIWVHSGSAKKKKKSHRRQTISIDRDGKQTNRYNVVEVLWFEELNIFCKLLNERDGKNMK